MGIFLHYLLRTFDSILLTVPVAQFLIVQRSANVLTPSQSEQTSMIAMVRNGAISVGPHGASGLSPVCK